jgi:predicted DNA-binding protein (UPF0251 family)
MARPCKRRYITTVPEVTDFCPRTVPRSAGPPSELMADELEALRLADVEGLSQEEGAARMNVSRATFGRILERAHRTVADALVNCRLLRIGGGDVVATRHRHLHCRRCRRDWDVPQAVAATFRCPRCHG